MTILKNNQNKRIDIINQKGINNIIIQVCHKTIKSRKKFENGYTTNIDLTKEEFEKLQEFQLK